VLSILLLAAAGAAAWFAYTKIQDQLSSNKPVSVPPVAGIRESLAVGKIRGAGLVPAVQRRSSTTVEKGVVIKQSPPAGLRVQKNQTVTLTVSKGPPEVQVPSVIGKSRDDAVSTLVNAGLKAQPVVSVPSNRPEGTVTAQEPSAGMTVIKGSRVRINVSSGPAEVDVPSVIGLTFDQASATLQNDGFAVARTNVDSDQPKDTVVDQSPSGRAKPGSTINLSVSKGPKMSTVPDVTSQDEASARSTLESAGFHVSVQRQEVNDPGLGGIVLSQEPTGGTKAKQGSVVTIFVGHFSSAAPPPPPP
jgi:beta-lactam-binding protein with PASTA domain